MRAQLTGRRRDRGAALLEMAIVMPVLFALLMAVAEFGMGWRDRLTVQSAVRSALRAASSMGDDPAADYQLLQSFRGALGSIPTANVERLVVYRSVAGDGAVHPPCRTGGSSNNWCNVYTGADLLAPATSFGCSASSRDRWWCPRDRSVDPTSAHGPDYLGIEVVVRRDAVTGMFGRSATTIIDRAVVRLEPR
jgi:hypothetical protein